MVAAATGIPRLPIAAAQERGPPVEGQRGRDALPRVRIPFAAARERGPPFAAARERGPPAFKPSKPPKPLNPLNLPPNQTIPPSLLNLLNP